MYSNLPRQTGRYLVLQKNDLEHAFHGENKHVLHLLAKIIVAFESGRFSAGLTAWKNP